MSVIFVQEIEILRPGLVDDPYSTKPVLDYNNPTIIPVDFPVSVQPVSSTEQGVFDADRHGIVSQFRLITPPGTDLDLQSTDRVRLGGLLVMNAIGHPAKWPDPFRPGEVHHVEATLEVHNG